MNTMGYELVQVYIRELGVDIRKNIYGSEFGSEKVGL